MLLWSGQTISNIGTYAAQIVIPLLVLELTDSPTAAGIASGLGWLPYVLLSLPVGALVDRWDRKRVMILCDIGRTLALASIPVAMAFSVLTIWQLYLAALVEGSLFVFFNLAEVAALARVVPKAQLPEAVAQNQVGFGLAFITGPALGTFLYASLGRAVPFIVDAVSYAVSFVSLFFIKTRFQTERPSSGRNLRLEILEGLSWLWHQPLIRFMGFVTGGLNFIDASSTLIIIVLAKNLNISDVEIGMIFSVGAIGAILGSIVGGRIQKRFRYGQVIPAVVGTQALLFPLYAFAPHFYMLSAITVLIYLTGPVFDIVQFSYRIALIPDALQGRVNGNFRLLAHGFRPVGAAMAGLLIERLGVVPTVFVFSAGFIALAIAVAINPYIRNARPIQATP